VLASRTPTISGLISTRRYALPHSEHEHPCRGCACPHLVSFD
jgi:hypothetical protein